jgi:hypothetical protein
MATQNQNTIETAFLSNADVKKALKIGEFAKLNAKEIDLAKRTLQKGLEKAKIVGTGLAWFESEEGQKTMQIFGLKWNAEQFFLNAYGLSKAQGHKYARASKIDEAVVTAYAESCGENPSIEKLLKFAKDSESGVVNDTEGGEGEGTSDKAFNIFNLTYKGGDSLGNVSIKVDSKGKVSLSGSPEALKAMQTTLAKAIAEAGK